MSTADGVGTEVGICANCGELATRRCGNCRQVFYCKKDCQKDDWKKGHKEECRPVQVEKCPELGLYLVATRNLKPGDIIIKEDPLVVGPLKITEPVCLSCYKRVNGSYRCSKCNWPLCGPECEAGFDHQPECIVGREMGSPIEIANFNETNHFYEVVTPLRCLALKKRSPKKYSKMLELESHYEDRKGTQVFEENTKRIVNMLRNYFMIVDFDPEVMDSSDSTIHKITGILDLNSVEIDLGEVCMLALFPTFSILEHSCIPNTKYCFNNKRQIIVKAAVEIKKGEHLSTMHSQILWGTLARREHLKVNKYFMCKCKRCADPTELGTNFSAIRCQNCPQGYLTSAAPLDELADWICSRCSITMPVDKVKNITLDLGEEVEKALMSPTIESLEDFLTEKEATLLHPSHFHLFAIRHTLLQLYGRTGQKSEDQMKKKEKLCQEFLRLCNTLDPSISRLAPYASVALYELHLAIMSRNRQNVDGTPADAAIIRRDIEAAKALLKQCINMLQDEGEMQPHGQLAEIARENLKELEDWEFKVK